MKLRPAQEAVLSYRKGRMAVSAVPGSGKTFTLSLLAAKLIAEGYEGGAEADVRFDPRGEQQVLVVTYLNTSVYTFRARIRRRLEELELLPDQGYEVRTLHSLALEIVRVAEKGLGQEEPQVLDDTQRGNLLSRAVDVWQEENRALWEHFLPDETPQMRVRWRDITEDVARAFIRSAKNARYHPQQIRARLESGELVAAATAEPGLDIFESPLLHMAAGIYSRYQSILERQGVLDFDDLIWRAADLLEDRPDLAAALRVRWPYVLEDEAQDSVPLQEQLLSTLTGPLGNWVRVGDPNQAITSSFTAAHPRYFNAFLQEPDVEDQTLPNSGRSSQLIMNAANRLVDWTIDEHPVPEVRAHTFRRQHILPTPPGDSQPNPPESESSIRIRVYKHREEEELPAVARLAQRYTEERPEQTVAILVPTHQIGYKVAEHLDKLDATYDNLLRGGSRAREVASILQAVLAVLADPLDMRALVTAFASLQAMEHPAARVPEERVHHLQTLLRSVYRPEMLLFPAMDGEAPATALPEGVADEEDVAAIERFTTFLNRLFALRPLPIADLTLTVGDELFAQEEVHEGDLAIAYQIAMVLRHWQDAQPQWRLPDFAAELDSLARGRQGLPIGGPTDYGYEPEPGRISLMTQHSAKGLEWDGVFLVGIDNAWIPSTLAGPFRGVHEFLGGNPQAEVNAQLRYLMEGKAGLHDEHTATESAHVEVISERLRLLYVGITRARRFLQISRSRAAREYQREQINAPSNAVGALYEYLSAQEGESG